MASLGKAPRPVFLFGGALLLTAILLSYAAFSLVEMERKVLAAAEAEGRALLQAVSAGLERSLLASRTVEDLLADRLLRIAREAGNRLLAGPGREERVLLECVRHHGLKGALYLDPGLRVVVATSGAAPAGPRPGNGDGPPGASRLAPLVAEDIVRRARERGLGEAGHVVMGFGESPFGSRTEFLVGIRLPENGNYLLLRQDAESLAALRRDTGVERVLRDAADSPGIAWLLLQGPDGVVLAANDPVRVGERLPDPPPGATWAGGAGERVLDISLPASWEGSQGATLRVGLAAGPVEEVLRRGRAGTLLVTAIAAALALAGALSLALLDRSRRGKERELEREIARGERAAELGRLSGAVAHEVRSPLNAIGMAAQRLERALREDAPDPEALRDILSGLRREVGRLNRTVEEFLDLGRQRPLERRDVDLAALARELVQAEAPDARIEAPPGEVELRADPEELRKALGNLLRNARAAAGEAPVVLAWRRVGDLVELEVRDGGPGIPPEEREEVFRSFYTRRPGGSGLGLAVVRSVAERHGGTVRVDEAPEGGARFVLSLPRGGDR